MLLPQGELAQAEERIRGKRSQVEDLLIQVTLADGEGGEGGR